MTAVDRDPFVVVIDDDLDKVHGLVEDLRKTPLEVSAVEPRDLDESMLRDGTIFLVDLFLSDWPGRERLAPAAQVFDGVALAAVIRAHSRYAHLPSPIVALNTGRASDFSDLPLEIREHAIARANNLEWVFLKDDSRSSAPTHERVAELATAQRLLPAEWRDESGEIELLRVLSAQEEELSEVLDAWPPIREVGADTAGIAVLRWLLHRILPYPCFLLDKRHVSVRLGLTSRSFENVIAGGGRLAAELEESRYTGILAGFDGPRWWRPRIETMLWNLSTTKASPATTEELQIYTKVQLEHALPRNGVVVLDADYTPQEIPVDVVDAVRIRLDDWPPYAEDAWASAADARRDNRLRDRVLPIDRPRLETQG